MSDKVKLDNLARRLDGNTLRFCAGMVSEAHKAIGGKRSAEVLQHIHDVMLAYDGLLAERAKAQPTLISDYIRVCETARLGAPDWMLAQDPDVAFRCEPMTAKWDDASAMVQIHTNGTADLWVGRMLFGKWSGTHVTPESPDALRTLLDELHESEIAAAEAWVARAKA